MPLAPNAQLARYKILSLLGAGGMGEVYLAVDTRLDRKVALKILPPEFAEDKDRMNRFVREAKSASALNHPNIITIHEIGESTGTHYIATEFIEGETLHNRLKAENLSLEPAMDISVQIVSSLQAAHAANIIHRDIKPDNIMIRADGLVKILDFGIAKLSAAVLPQAGGLNVDEEAATAIKPQSTNPGMIIGTANYMSPEQAKGEEIDARSDIFSFGIVLYEMLTGRRPFAGDTPLQVISSILKDEPQPINQLLPALPREIERIVNKTLRKDRDERYQTAHDLLTDLKDARQELESQQKLHRTAAPHAEEAQTQMLNAPTSDISHTISSAEFISQEIRRHKRGAAVACVVLLSAIIGLGYWYLSHRATSDKQINSIAVLPFENNSSDADSDYLSDGLAESLIYRLSQLPNLKVSPTSSVFRYKGKKANPQVVSQELGVDSVMTGRIVQRGDNLTISVNLVDTRNGKSLWGERYERKMSELLATQGEIAGEIANNLKRQLSGEGEQKLAKNYTDNNEAYQLYLKGNYYKSKYTDEGYKKAISYYQQAIEVDANYALAYAGIANAYLSVAEVYFPMNEGMPKAKTAVLKALEIDNSLAEAHALLGAISIWYEWDWAAGERELKRAIELDPNNGESHHQYGWYFAMTGRLGQAIIEGELAHHLAPLDINISGDLVGFYLFSGRNDDALRQSQKTIEIDPNSGIGYNGLGMAYAGKRQFPEAIAAMEKAHSLDNSPWLSGFRGYVYASAGKKVEAQKVLDELEELSKRQYVPAYNVAFIYAGLNNKNKAFELLNKAFETHSGLSVIKVETSLSKLRDDPRFKEMLKRLNLPE